MSVDTIEARRITNFIDQDDRFPEEIIPEADTYTELNDEAKTVVFIGAAGGNVGKMERVGSLAALEAQQPVDYIDMRPPKFAVAPDRLHLVGEDEGRASAERRLGEGTVGLVYVSTVPVRHEIDSMAHLERFAAGENDGLVITKPLAPTVEAARRIAKKAQEATERRQALLGDEFDPSQKAARIHEHYPEKSPFREVERRLPQLMEQYGCLQSVVFTIQECKSVEEEKRGAALADGAIKDVAVHQASMALELMKRIDDTDRYAVRGRADMTVHRLRYDGATDVTEGIETGFIISGAANLIDERDNVTHPLQFIWQGGKGLGEADKKEAVFTFVNEHGSTTTITADLSAANTLDIPVSAQAIFADMPPLDDDGYGRTIVDGLRNGGDPDRHFQSIEDATTALRWSALADFLGRNSLHSYTKGTSLEDLGKKLGITLPENQLADGKTAEARRTLH